VFAEAGASRRSGYHGPVATGTLAVRLTAAQCLLRRYPCCVACRLPCRQVPGLCCSRSLAPLSLSCSDSAGQQGHDHEAVTGGVEGLVLPGSGDPTACTRSRASSGSRYFIYKAFLAVSAAAAPFATVSVDHPASARLVYGSPSRIGALFSTRAGQALLTASRARTAPVCGPRFTGFTGGVHRHRADLRHLRGLLTIQASGRRHRPHRRGHLLTPAGRRQPAIRP